MSDVTVIVRNSLELSSAIKQLSDGAGGTIRVMNAGETYALSKYRAGTDAGAIQIVAADPNDRPVLEQVKLIEARNMVFSGLIFDSIGSDLAGKDLQILKSSAITFEKNTFVNSSNGFYTGQDDGVVVGGSLGLVRDSKNIVFSGNDVSKYNHALAVIDSIGTVITGNVFSKLTGDGLRLSGVQDTLIEGNLFTAFYGSTQNVNHSDMIQVWSAPYNALNTENLTIRGNILNSSAGAATQTIFIKNETYKETGIKFRDITVEDNTIYNGHIHGVAIYNTGSVLVKNNTILWNTDATMQSMPTSKSVTSAPQIRLYDVEDGVVIGNIVSGVFASGNTVMDNAIISFGNPTSENYVGNNFVNAVEAGAIDLRDMALLSDSVWNDRFGSSTTNIPVHTDSVIAVIVQQQEAGSFGRVTYDASLSFGAEGVLPSGSTKYIWTFSDGTVLEGMRVIQDFATDGIHEVSLTVFASTGTDSITRSTKIEVDTLVEINFDSGIIDDSSYVSSLTEIGTHVDVAGVNGGGFYLNGSNKLQIDGENTQIQNMKTFTLELSLQRDLDGEAGTFIHMHNTLRGKVTEDGAVSFTLNTTDGSFFAKTAPSLIVDSDWHDLSISFGEENGGLKIYIDDMLSAKTEATGIVMPTGTAYDLVIGNSWNDSLQGVVDNFRLRRSIEDVAEINKDLSIPKGAAVFDENRTYASVFAFPEIGQEYMDTVQSLTEAIPPLNCTTFSGRMATLGETLDQNLIGIIETERLQAGLNEIWQHSETAYAGSDEIDLATSPLTIEILDY